MKEERRNQRKESDKLKNILLMMLLIMMMMSIGILCPSFLHSFFNASIRLNKVRKKDGWSKGKPKSSYQALQSRPHDQLHIFLWPNKNRPNSRDEMSSKREVKVEI